MRKIREKVGVLKKLKRELKQAHKLSRTESGFPGILWWHLKYWDKDLGLKVKKEEPLTPTLQNIKVKSPPTPNLQYPSQNHWPGEKHPNKGKGQKSQKVLSSSGNKKKADKKGKGKDKAQSSANVLEIVDLNKYSITSSESINFSCYGTSEKVEWFLDSGCTNHITPRKSDFVQYRELGQAHSIEIADGKYLKIEGYGTVIGHSIMQEGMASLQI